MALYCWPEAQKSDPDARRPHAISQFASATAQSRTILSNDAPYMDRMVGSCVYGDRCRVGVSGGTGSDAAEFPSRFSVALRRRPGGLHRRIARARSARQRAVTAFFRSKARLHRRLSDLCFYSSAELLAIISH